jgi:hypothetical protein
MSPFERHWERFILAAEQGDVPEVIRIYRKYSDFPEMQAQLLKCNFYVVSKKTKQKKNSSISSFD